MKKGFLLLLLLLFLLTPACEEATKSNESANTDGSANDAVNSMKSIYPNGLQSFYACCGGSCYIKSGYGFKEFKDTKIITRVHSDNLSEADRLNGIEWRGKIIVYGGNTHRRSEDGRWNEWFTGDDGSGDYGPYHDDPDIRKHTEMLEIFAWKQNNKWTYNGGGDMRPITCTEIPK